MLLTDTHTHLYLDDFSPSNEEAVIRAVDAGVGMMIFPNVNLSTVAPMLALHEKFPDSTRVAFGLHPTEVNAQWHKDLEAIPLDRADAVAIGEIGMDLYWDKTFEAEQMEAFRAQCVKAVELDLPVIIHQREALPQTLEVLRSLPEIPRGVFHSFTGTADDVKLIRKVGDFYFGINGIVTFKNARIRDVLPEIGIERILLETDSPYLAPVPHRGKRNESSFLPHIAGYVAQSMGLSAEEVADITTENAKQLFRL